MPHIVSITPRGQYPWPLLEEPGPEKPGMDWPRVRTQFTTVALPSRTTERKLYLIKGLRNICLIPVLPLVMYLALDASGFSSFLASQSDMLKRMWGEGFGHAGLCFSLHFVLDASKSFWKAWRLRPAG